LPVTNSSTQTGGGLVSKPIDVDVTKHNIEIPKEGITKPFTPNTHVNTSTGVNIGSQTGKTYLNQNGPTNDSKAGINIKPNEGNAGIYNSTPNRWESKDERVNTFNGGNLAPKYDNNIGIDITGKNAEPKTNTKPFVQQNNDNEPEGWHTAPPDRWNNKPRMQQQPNQTDWNKSEQPRGNYSEPQKNDAPQYTPKPRNENNNWNGVEPRNEQPRNNFEQRNFEKPNIYAQPQQPRMNIQPQQQPRQENFNRSEPRSMQQQRSFSPAPQNNGGGFKRH